MVEGRTPPAVLLALSRRHGRRGVEAAKLSSVLAEWVEKQVRTAQLLVGRHVESWSGVEMAFREVGPNGHPDFDHSAAPCLQLLFLDAHLDDQSTLAIVTYQNNNEFGLSIDVNRDISDAAANWDGIYRFRQLALPFGRIESFGWQLSQSGDLTEVCFDISGAPLWMIAGETHETWSGELEFHRFDESVLVFESLSAIEAIKWIPPRVY
jgi:hypothetical protein